jgi:transcriptional regulator with XRE-family HTH domain
MMTSAQCRGARAMLGWSREQLAGASKVALRTIVDFEREAREARHATLAAIQRALESAGVEFTNGGQPGVRMKGAFAARAVIAKGAEARGKAKTAVDKALADVDAGHEEKAARKRKLTSVPKELKAK